MQEITINIETLNVSPMVRNVLIDNLSKCILDTFPRRADTKITVNVSGVFGEGKRHVTYGMDIVYRLPEASQEYVI